MSARETRRRPKAIEESKPDLGEQLSNVTETILKAQAIAECCRAACNPMHDEEISRTDLAFTLESCIYLMSRAVEEIEAIEDEHGDKDAHSEVLP